MNHNASNISINKLIFVWNNSISFKSQCLGWNHHSSSNLLISCFFCILINHGFLSVAQYSATDFPFKVFLNLSIALVLLTPSWAESKAINIAKSLVLVRVRFAKSHWSYFPSIKANLLNGSSLCLKFQIHLCQEFNNSVLTWHEVMQPHKCSACHWLSQGPALQLSGCLSPAGSTAW